MRIGIYRIMRVLDALGLRATAIVNSAIAARYPRIVDEIVRRSWEIACGGIDMGHIHHGKTSPEVERALVQNSRDALQKASGQSIAGWHSPGHSQSSNTLQLLVEEGFKYVMDWANDDMPYGMNTAAGPLVAMPLTYEWSDRVLLVQHNLTVDEYERQVMHAFQRLLTEAKKQRSGRILSLSISPWVLGYPHRIAMLERMLKRILDGKHVWNTTGKEIVNTLA
jgi:peptidoglycan/xylan/chitin deacetylase (PgdA/CDA1 family)